VPLALGGGAAVAIVAATSLFRPLPAARAEALASMVTDPAAHQTCTDVSSQVDVCVYTPYRDHGQRLADEISPVAAAIPPSWRGDPVVLRQRFDANPFDLPDAVQRYFPDGFDRGPTEDLFAGFSSHPEAYRAGRLRLAAHVVGLPTDPVFPGVSVAGQARGVVALWLSVRGMTEDAERALTPDYGSPDQVSSAMRGSVWPGLCHGEENAIVWSQQDLEGARALLAVPEAEVAEVLDDDWERWTDPATATDELLRAFGLDPVGPADEVDPAEADQCG
jgi:hypothetical protein